METKNTQKTPDLAQNSKSTDSKAPQVKTDFEKTLEAAQDATKAPEDEISPEAKNTPADNDSTSEEEITLEIGDIVKYNLTGEESRKYEKATGSRVDAIIIAVEAEDEEDFHEAKLDLQVFPDGYADSEKDDDSQVSFIVRAVKCEEAFSEKTTLTWGVTEKSIFE